MTEKNSLYRNRLTRAAAAMNSAGVDCLLLCPGADQFYLTGFEHGHAAERLLALAVNRDGSSHWIAPAMNVSQVQAHALPDQPIAGWTDAETYHPALRKAVGDARTIAFDDEARSGFLLDCLSAAPKAKLVHSGSVMSLRIHKDAAEITALRAAAQTVDQAIPQAIKLCRPSRTELEVDTDLRAALQARSPASTVAFTLIASGPNGAFPHHETGRRPMEQGDVVVLDYGTRLAGYHSDITVTCSIGQPRDPETRKVYDTVYRAQQAAIQAVRPGVPCQEIDRTARRVIESAGYGPHFLHRTGHGLGLQVHEPPFMVEGNAEKLEEGMVFSIEPGIYLPGRFGIRLEIIATVTADGVSLINAPSASELPVV